MGIYKVHAATSRGDIDIMRSLITAGAGVNRKTPDGDTPIHIAITRAHPYNRIQLLINSGANLNISDNQGNYPIHTAIETNEYLQYFQQLINYGANINVANNAGERLYTSHLNIVEMIN